jgi:hypothetical protein
MSRTPTKKHRPNFHVQLFDIRVLPLFESHATEEILGLKRLKYVDTHTHAWKNESVAHFE